MAEQLYGAALGTTLPASKLHAEVESWMRGLGYSSPPASYDREGEYKRFGLLPRVDGGTWIVLEHEKRSSMPWAIALAKHLRSSVDVFEVSAFDNPKRGNDGDLAYELSVHAVAVAADGSIGSPRVSPSDDSSPLLREYGDFYETVSYVLYELVEGSLPPTSENDLRLELYRPGRTSQLSERLVGIVESLESASAVTLLELEGSQFLRIEMAEGSSRMARITAEELETLRQIEHLGVPQE